MRFSRLIYATTGAVALATLAACASPDYYDRQPAPVVSSQPYPPAYPPAQSASYIEYGRVSAVDVIRTEERNRPSGAGAVIGGIAGAVLGNQIGGGTGRAVATVAGAAGGAMVGNRVEGNRTSVNETYRVSIRVDNGTVRAYDVPTPGDLRVGDRVRIQDGQISRI
ncbi:MAG: glycine zipper 2TM domain-containing protein [Alphaproteobacteria bacterium]|nr:MAG: glycine zipper 2TM domain-containing protein [Alphaproteobacteria bacterium]